MEFVSFNGKEKVLHSLCNIKQSIHLLQAWGKDIVSADDYLLSPEGMKNLAASCMMIEAIGEAFKKIDKETNGTLLVMYPGIPWKAVKGIRDHIAHGYFEIDADIIFSTVKENLDPLLEATSFFINVVSDVQS